MAYSELIKNFKAIRDYMRQFYVYGFKSRTEYDAKSARSYDDVRRRIDSWLGEYMSFHQCESGKAQFLSVDSRQAVHNPLYQAFKAKSFTDNSIILHFFLLDLLADGKWYTFRDIADGLFECDLDESTIRNKVNDYTRRGILEKKKEGKSFLYRLSENKCDGDSWKDAAAYFSEVAPLGVIGSYIGDRTEFAGEKEIFRYKHHYILHALDSEILFEIFSAMEDHRHIELHVNSRRQEERTKLSAYPMKIYCSTQTGREYLLAFVYDFERIAFFRLDNIFEVKAGAIEPDYEFFDERYEKLKPHLWGVSLGAQRKVDHLEMTVHVEEDESFIVNRLEREKRNGAVSKIGSKTYRYTVDCQDAMELLPWIRTFIGRIEELSCSNREVERLFFADLEEMEKMYEEFII